MRDSLRSPRILRGPWGRERRDYTESRSGGERAEGRWEKAVGREGISESTVPRYRLAGAGGAGRAVTNWTIASRKRQTGHLVWSWGLRSRRGAALSAALAVPQRQ